MAEDLSANQLDEFKGVFAELEKDGDGSVTTKELGAFLRSIGQTPTHAELQDMILEIDQDGRATTEGVYRFYFCAIFPSSLASCILI